MSLKPSQRWQPVSQDEKHLLERYSDDSSEDSGSALFMPRTSLRDLGPFTKVSMVFVGVLLLGSLALNMILLRQEQGMDLDQLCTRHTTIACTYSRVEKR
jgi:hypothetical protein